MGVIQWLLEHGDKLSAFTILGAGSGAIIWAWLKGHLVSGKEVVRLVALYEKSITDAKEVCRGQSEMNARLLAQLERSVTITEDIGTTAKAVITRRAQ